ncbi:MAG: hypothetical protein KZQ73_10690 [Candidatus Thiodiazotropha sp. (ex Semelilucina semeliformis)]|nr:hypothetical protein [Candidatus Thiodiazotropha sp. (ex Semelilucina semeliformis)]
MTQQDQQRNPTDDRQLSELYRASRNEQPAAELDAAILAQAHAQARSRRRRWMLPLSTAAVILLGTSLTLTLVQPPVSTQLPDEKTDVMSEALEEMTPKASSPPAAAPAMKRQAVAPAGEPPVLELQSAMPSRAEMDADVLAPMERRASEMKREKSSFGQAMAEKEAIEVLRTPEAWINDMHSLLRDGEVDALEQELAAFREHYPDTPLPPELEAIRKRPK